MIRIDLGQIIGWIVGILVVALFVWLFVGLGMAFSLERKCLIAGYPNSHLTWNFQGFCSREENEYEIVVPLRDLE